MTGAKYLYCIIRGSEERTFEDVAPIGEPQGPVHTVCHNGLAVVVSDSALSEYETTRAHLQAHERAQERVMQEYTLLPVRFGTVAGGASARQDIQKLLQKRGREFEGLLAEMEGKVELGLKALWREEPALYAELLAENPGLRRLRDSLGGRRSQAVLVDRVGFGERVKEALGRKRAAEAARLLLPLRRIASRTVESPIVVDRMIANAAFLVDKKREEEFDQAVRKLDAELGQRLAFKYVGAVPPYNFVNIVVNWEAL